MSTGNTVRCEKCPAYFRFIPLTKKDGTLGRPAPIECLASDKGNIRVVETAKGEAEARILTGEELAWARELNEPLYLNHFASCPAAASFLRPKK